MAHCSLFALALLLFINMSQANETKLNGFSLRLIHRDSLDSPLYQSLSRNNYSISQVRGRSLVARQSTGPDGVYYVPVGIGTFRGNHPSFKTYYLMLDTGSSWIWTQCHGCHPGFHQQGPPFPMHQSQTYRQLPCGQCPGAMCVHNVCTVDYEYLGGTRVQGISAFETLTFASNFSGDSVTIPNLRFLCVIRSQNVALGEHNIASGILGMNRHPTSFMGQFGELFGGRFSYCFPPYHNINPPDMFLRLGGNPPVRQMFNCTPLIQGPHSRYYLDLESITVGDNTLPIPRSVFRLKRDGSGGSYISSGSKDTLLVDVAYRVFQTDLIQRMTRKYPGIRTVTQNGNLCFEKELRRGERIEFPEVTFHFAKNAKFVINQKAYLDGFHVNPSGYATHCLLIFPSSESTVLGTRQQVNHRIIYDIANSELLFKPEDCT